MLKLCISKVLIWHAVLFIAVSCLQRVVPETNTLNDASPVTSRSHTRDNQNGGGYPNDGGHVTFKHRRNIRVTGSPLKKRDIQTKNGVFLKEESRITTESARRNSHKLSKRRKKCDWLSRLKHGYNSSRLKQRKPNEKSTGTGSTNLAGKHRRRRYDYEDDYEWENSEIDYDSEPETVHEKLLRKLGENWQVTLLKGLFVICFVVFVIGFCVCWYGRGVVQCCKACAVQSRELADWCKGRDPSYIQAKTEADKYGIKLDYPKYLEMKKQYEDWLAEQGYEVDLSGKKGAKGEERPMTFI